MQVVYQFFCHINFIACQYHSSQGFKEEEKGRQVPPKYKYNIFRQGGGGYFKHYLNDACVSRVIRHAPGLVSAPHVELAPFRKERHILYLTLSKVIISHNIQGSRPPPLLYISLELNRILYGHPMPYSKQGRQQNKTDCKFAPMSNLCNMFSYCCPDGDIQ